MMINAELKVFTSQM